MAARDQTRERLGPTRSAHNATSGQSRVPSWVPSRRMTSPSTYDGLSNDFFAPGPPLVRLEKARRKTKPTLHIVAHPIDRQSLLVGVEQAPDCANELRFEESGLGRHRGG